MPTSPALLKPRALAVALLGLLTSWGELVGQAPGKDAGQLQLVGSYRTESGRVLGIAPFSEFGDRLMVIDYESGRIGPLSPVSGDRWLVGGALISNTQPGDSLIVVRSAAGAVEGIRWAESGVPEVVALRLATRDEPVTFGNGAVQLAGTLVLPVGTPPFPAVVLVHGSNAQTRDALGPWTRFFAAQGIAVLSYDKRGTGSSTGDWKSADFEALAGDVLAGVRFLRARTDVAPGKVGLWGVSQAGWILPIVASQASGEVAFLVVHAGSGTTVREEGVLYLRAELRAAGLPPASVAVGTRYQELDDIVSATGKGHDQLTRYYEEHRKVETWLWPPRPADDWFRGYYRMLMDFDPAPYWEQVRVPVLFFFGELDANVPPAESWPPIERALRRSGNPRVTQVVLPRANHVFLEAKTGGRDEYPALSRFVPGYFGPMAAWLKETVR